MILDIFVKFGISLMNLYAKWVPDWSMPDGLVTSFTYIIEYSKYIGVWINTQAFYGSIVMVFETLLIITILKAIAMFLGFLRGTKID